MNPTKLVVFDFSETRKADNVNAFLRLDTPAAWSGPLVTDGFSGNRAATTKGVASAQCMAQAWRRLHELWADKGNEVERQALRFHQVLSGIEREVEDASTEERRRRRQGQSRRVLSAFHHWLFAQRQLFHRDRPRCGPSMTT